MKIAIQLFGHLRTFEETYKLLFKNIVNYNKRNDIEFDIFLHSWDESDSKQKASYKKSKKYMGKKLDKSTLNLIEKYYSPKAFLIESQHLLTEADKAFMKINNISENSFSMIKNVSYSIMQSNKLREKYEEENNITYDFIIMTRPDILFMKSLNLQNLKNLSCRGEGKFTQEFLNNSIFTSYILSDFSGQIMKQDFYLCGVDLFAMMSPKIASEIAKWHFLIKENDFKGLFPEASITKIIAENKCIHNYIGYEKDKYWIILRNNFFYMKSPYFAPIRLISNFLFDIFKIILLVTSIKFRQMTLFNPHLLERRHKRSLKNFLK